MGDSKRLTRGRGRTISKKSGHFGEVMGKGHSVDSATTKGAIRRAVVEAMQRKDITDITITELCSACGIARSTFYRYYDSVDDVVKKTGDELLASIRRASALDRYDGTHSIADGPRQSDLARAQVLKEYGPFICAVTGFHGDPSFAFKAVGLMRELWLESNHDDWIHRPYGDFMLEFFLAGTFRMIDHWLRSHPEMSAEEFYGLQVEIYKKPVQVATGGGK